MAEIKHKHKVFIHDSGAVCVKFVGEIAVMDLEDTLIHLNDAIQKKSLNAFRPSVLADVTELEKVKLDARKIGVAWLKEKRYEKLAAVCHSVFIRHFVQMLIVASRLEDQMKVFNNETEAINWMK